MDQFRMCARCMHFIIYPNELEEEAKSGIVLDYN